MKPIGISGAAGSRVGRIVFYASAAALGILFVFSSIYLSISYSKPSATTRSITVADAEIETPVSYIFHVKPTMLYDYNTRVGGDSSPAAITRGLYYNMSIRYTGPAPRNTYYRRVSVVATREWSKTLNDTGWIAFPGNQRLNESYINTTRIDEIVSTINKELGLGGMRGYTYTEKTMILVRTRSESYYAEPTLTVKKTGSDKKIHVYVDGTENTYTHRYGETRETTISIGPFTEPTRDARRIFFYTTLASGLGLAAATYYALRADGYDEEERLRRHGVEVIDGRILGISAQTTVLLRDIGDLARIAVFENKPIIRKSGEGKKTYAVIGDTALYIYREPATGPGGDERETNKGEMPG